VASYLSFGLVNGVGLWSAEGEQEGKGKGKVERVPASKTDVFNHPTLSLVEKRRLTKLLLLAAGQDAFEEDQRLKGESLQLGRRILLTRNIHHRPRSHLPGFLAEGGQDLVGGRELPRLRSYPVLVFRG